MKEVVDAGRKGQGTDDPHTLVSIDILGVLLRKQGKLQEAEAMALKHFDEVDSNHDGQVTPDERGKRHRMMIKEIRKEAPTAG